MTDDVKRTFDRDGFCTVRGFLAADLLDELTANLDRYIRDIVPSLPDAAAFYQDRSRPETLKQLHQMGRDPYFDEIRRSERWRSLAESLLGERVASKEPEWFNKPPGTGHATPPHQDNYYFCLAPPHVVTLWLALDEVDEQNGCLRYVVGSHLRGLRPHGATSVLGFSQGVSDFGPADERHERSVCLAPGDLVAHHGETIHRADANRSEDRQRRAFAIVFYGTSCGRDEAAFTRYRASMQRQHQGLGLGLQS